jgi:hypothetical protein
MPATAKRSPLVHEEGRVLREEAASVRHGNIADEYAKAKSTLVAERVSDLGRSQLIRIAQSRCPGLAELLMEILGQEVREGRHVGLQLDPEGHGHRLGVAGEGHRVYDMGEAYGDVEGHDGGLYTSWS